MILTALPAAADRLAGALAAVCATLAFALAAPGAHAEKADRDKPIHLEADRVTVDDAKQISTFEGNVVLTQGTMMIRGNRMEVRQDAEGFRRGTAWGSLAYFRQKREGYDEYIEGWAERIEYDTKTEKVQLHNRAMLKRGNDEVRGQFIAYDAPTEFFQVMGGATKAAGSPDGRVRAVMNPKPKAAPPQPPVPLKPTDNLSPTREEPVAPTR